MRIIGLMILLLLVSCGPKKTEKKAEAVDFPKVSVPEMISGQADIAEYLAMNYWDGLTDPSRTYPCDSTLVSGVRKTELEQKFADWTAVLDLLPPQTSDKAISKLFTRALACEKKDTSSNVFETFNLLTYKYFYSPNSPLRNEDYYHPYVKNLANCELISEEMRGKHAFEARMTGLNRRGTIAADFNFCDKNGQIHSLHGIQASLTLLFFSNPGCQSCKDIIEVLSTDPYISERIASRELAVLNIYIDEDLAAWREYMPVYPESWYNGFDPELILKEDTIYNIRAIPSLYLLDHEKRVILKDAPESKVLNMLLRNQ